MYKRKISIFLASSIVEFANERRDIENFIRNVSDKFEERYDTKIQPLLCENFDNCMSEARKQEEYNEKIRESEMCFFIFFTRAGEFTREEFEVAYKQFKESETHRPKIYVYFKKVPEGVSVEQSVKDFMNEIDNTYQHYHDMFDHIDTVKLRILLNLKMQEMDFANIEIKNGECVVDGNNMMSLDKVSEFANSKNLQRMKAELAEIEEKYFKMLPIYAKGGFDESFRNEYVNVASKRQSMKKQIEDLEKSIFDLSLGLSKDEVRGEMTPRMKEAYRLLELGDSEGCIAVLNSEDIDSEFERWEREHEREGKKKASIYIREHKIAIDILKTMPEYSGRFAEIEARFEKITSAAEKYGVELDVLYDYAVYLYNQNKHIKAIEAAEKLEKFYAVLGDVSENEIAKLYNLMALLYSDTQRYTEAEEMHKKAIQIRERLAGKKPDAFEPNLALSYNNLANLFYKTQRYTDAEDLYKKAAQIRERLAGKNPDAFEPDLALSYNNLATLFYKTQRYTEAEDLYKKATQIRERLAGKKPDAFEPSLARNYLNLAILYKRVQRDAEAEEMNKKALEIAKKHPQNPYCKTIIEQFN